MFEIVENIKENQLIAPKKKKTDTWNHPHSASPPERRTSGRIDALQRRKIHSCLALALFYLSVTFSFDRPIRQSLSDTDASYRPPNGENFKCRPFSDSSNFDGIRFKVKTRSADQRFISKVSGRKDWKRPIRRDIRPDSAALCGPLKKHFRCSRKRRSVRP